jgi:two-component system chemotaxis sensor kinase CheA
VDGFLSTREVVIKQLGRQLRRVKNVAGATILGDGQLVVVLHASDLIRSIQETPSAAISPQIMSQKINKRRVLVVDDSITTRMLEKHILENAGYTVLTAADGQEAWEFICNREKEPVDLVISDINMPKMDGFMLTRSIKEDPHFAQIPVILVTSLESPQDKLRGLESGAEAYVVKKSFDQRELLETMDRLVG